MTRARRWAWAAAVLAVLVHLSAVGNGFAYDDVTVIQENEALHSWVGIAGQLVEPYWPGVHGEIVGVWRPVISALFGVEWMLFGGDPAGFHAVGILLHAASTFVLVLVLSALLPPLAAGIGGVLFAVHPVHVEAVANLVGNADVLASLFVLLALLLHVRGGEAYGWRRTGAVGLLFALGMLTKEHAIVLPGLVFLVDAARRDLGVRDARAYLARRWPTYAGLVAVAGAILLARTRILGEIAPAQAPAGATLLQEVPRVFTLASTWPHYVRLLLFPADLAADYGGIIPVVVRWTPYALFGAAIALFFLAVALWSWRSGPEMGPARLSRRALGFAVVWFVVTISPVSNVVFISPVLVAERNLYLPSVAAVVGVGYLLAALHRERRAAALLLTALLVVLGGYRSWERSRVWESTWSVFGSLLEDHPEAGRGWIVEGDRLLGEGHLRAARRAYAIGLGRLESQYGVAATVATRLMSMGPRYHGVAEFLLTRAWEEVPEHYTAPGYLAVLYLNQGRHAEGIEPARAAVAREPEAPTVRRVLAANLSGVGRHREAIEERLIALAQDDQPWRWWVWLAEDYRALGEVDAALAALDSARVRAPVTGPARAQIDSIRSVLAPTLVPPP